MLATADGFGHLHRDTGDPRQVRARPKFAVLTHTSSSCIVCGLLVGATWQPCPRIGGACSHDPSHLWEPERDRVCVPCSLFSLRRSAPLLMLHATTDLVASLLLDETLIESSVWELNVQV